RGLFEGGARGVEFLLAEERNAEIDAGDGEFRVGGEGFLEIFLSVGEFLLVHVGDAEGVEAEGVGGVGGCGGVGGGARGGEGGFRSREERDGCEEKNGTR